MKKILSNYIFEVIVIFIGITTSFLFEEWRQIREREQTASEITNSLIIELKRNDTFILYADTLYVDLNKSLETILGGNGLSDSILAETYFFLQEEIGKYQLEQISSFIHGFSSSDQLNLIEKNKEVLRYMSYLESLLSEHTSVTQTVSRYSSENIWPFIVEYGFSGNLIALQKKAMDLPSGSSFTSPRGKAMLNDEELLGHLKWAQLKILRLLEINEAIHSQISNLIRELEKN